MRIADKKSRTFQTGSGARHTLERLLLLLLFLRALCQPRQVAELAHPLHGGGIRLDPEADAVRIQIFHALYLDRGCAGADPGGGVFCREHKGHGSLRKPRAASETARTQPAAQKACRGNGNLPCGGHCNSGPGQGIRHPCDRALASRDVQRRGRRDPGADGERLGRTSAPLRIPDRKQGQCPMDRGEKTRFGQLRHGAGCLRGVRQCRIL